VPTGEGKSESGIILARVPRHNVGMRNSFTVHRLPPLWVALPVGGAIGFLSGIVGVGGGIFLSPLLILFRWADPKKVAATSAFFILVNSASGLWGRCVRGGFQMPPYLALLLLVAFFGGVIGSRIGARHFSNLWLKRVLALVLWMAVVKLIKHS